MDRKEIILEHVNREGAGVEIGPGYNPLVSKKEGYRVQSIDHLDAVGLREKYRDEGVDIGRIEEVDFVWDGRPYAELVGKRKHYDWIIASHVIEHTPDLIGFLGECDSILKDSGIVTLAVPDKRYCFDYFRPVSSIARIIDCHLGGALIHSPGTVAEHFLDVVSRGGVKTWHQGFGGEFELIHPPGEPLRKMNSVIGKKSYVDVHCWCFVPHSFRLLIHDLYTLGFIPFQELDFHPSQGCEFFLTLSRNGRGIGVSRLEMLKTIEYELTCR